ncbi:ferritin family protein [Candidatus Bathyarchaeota archaeon]|nr:ferritin family protein [Candidatus Bathyarchaeota archaeon]
MSKWSLDEILDLAILMEDQSIQIYTSAQDKVVNPGSKEMLKTLVIEEKGHKKRLLEIKEKAKLLEKFSSIEKIQDLKIADDLVKEPLSAESGYQEILVFAAKREKETHDMYINLAKKYKGSGVENTFMMLAQEELKHKYLLEKEYDDNVLIWM